MTLEQFKKKITSMPDSPGVYFFLGKHKEVLYIGKATNLRDRTRSYFAGDLMLSRGAFIVGMVEKASGIDWRATDSVLEALILEANLIKHYKPHYNTQAKDGKSFNYVVITKEAFPRVLVVRGKNLDLEFPAVMRAHVFGPFPHGLQLREAMKLIRKIFPYRDTCTPAAQMIAQGKTPRPCFNRHIGLCPGVCSGEITSTQYKVTVRHITLLFQGKKKQLLKELERDMKRAIVEEEFEQAAVLKRQVFALQHIQDVSLIKEEYHQASTSAVVRRIEAYDMAHLQGSANVGVMTVVEDGMAQPREYRKFRIRSASPGDDTGALKEVLSRRLGHDEWPMPQLIVVDGGTAQMHAASAVLQQFGMQIPVVGVVKDEKHRPKEIRGRQSTLSDSAATQTQERDILLANAEAHRFAIGYHRKRSRKEKGIY